MSNPRVLRKAGCRGLGVSHKYLFDSYLTTRLIRVSRKNRTTFVGLRHHATNAVKSSDVSTSIARSVSRIKKTSELKNLLLLAAPEKWTLMKAIAFLIVSSGVTMAVPFCFGKVIDVIGAAKEENENMKENLNRLTLVLLVVFLIGGLSNFRRVYLMSVAGHRITQSLRKQSYTAILRQEIAMFDKGSTGELVGRLSGIYFVPFAKSNMCTMRVNFAPHANLLFRR